MKLIGRPLLLSFVTVLFAALPAAEDAIERQTDWPKVEKAQQADLQKNVIRLRKARTPEIEEQARADLTELGAGAAPALLVALAKERDPEAWKRFEGVLGSITNATHTRLLAQEFTNKKPQVRIFSLRRAACFPDPGTLEAASAAWKDAQKRALKKKADKYELDAAALAVTAAGSLDGLGRVLMRTEQYWKGMQPTVRLAASGVRGVEATDFVLAWMEGKEPNSIIAGLRVLSGCGDPKTSPGGVRPYLGTEHAQVRAAAINALRGIVDNDPPLKRISAFDAIERAKRWKSRL